MDERKRDLETLIAERSAETSTTPGPAVSPTASAGPSEFETHLACQISGGVFDGLCAMLGKHPISEQRKNAVGVALANYVNFRWGPVVKASTPGGKLVTETLMGGFEVATAERVVQNESE